MSLRGTVTRCVTIALLSLHLLPSVAFAWIFPEHMEITRFATERDLPEPARVKLLAAVAAAAKAGLPLCEDFRPLERFADVGKVTCIPYTALAALAGDHANSVEQLKTILAEKDDGARDILQKVAERWKGYLNGSASPEAQRLYRSSSWLRESWQPSSANDSAPRRFTRELDIALNAIDSGYQDRAKGSRAHFQDSSTPIEILLYQLAARGNVDNVLAQMLAHHVRSLQLAAQGAAEHDDARRNAIWAEALLEHVSALHFVQDAFSAGHIGTEHGIGASIDRLRRHDFLNRAGINVQRAWLGARCSDVVAGQSNASASRSAEGAACWVAYGDAYLDYYNARLVANATARLQMQFALALDAQGSACPAGAACATCIACAGQSWFGGSQTATSTVQLPATARLGRLVDGAEERAATGDAPGLVFGGLAGEGIAHEYPCRFEGSTPNSDGTRNWSCVYAESPPSPAPEQRPHHDIAPPSRAPTADAPQLVIHVRSDDFDPYVVIRDDKGNKLGPKPVREGSNGFSLEATAILAANPAESYKVEIGSRNPNGAGNGNYFWWVTQEPANDVPRAADDCTTLLSEAALLDPAPTWVLSAEEAERRTHWSSEQRCQRAKFIVTSARRAIEKLAVRPLAAAASAGETSGAIPGAMPADLLENPLAPCTSGLTRTDPLCASGGGHFRFGSPEASLWWPILSAWPTPMGDITIIEGKDEFGTGFAAQLVFGAGPLVETAHDANFVFAGWFGTGLSYRVNDLFPARENRSVVEFNVTVAPTLSTVPRARFGLSGFLEGRVPVIPLLLAAAGKTTTTEYGPLGYRLYFRWPSLVPGGQGEWFVGHDIEVLNFVLDAGLDPRNKPAGHTLDKELRVRLGLFRESYFLGPGPRRWVPVLALEFAWGHSSYFCDVL